MSNARRQKHYWEPIFEGASNLPYQPGWWDKSDEQIYSECEFNWERDWSDKERKKIFKKNSYSHCDFRGERADSKSTIVFEDCDFEMCDFGLAVIKNCKFTKCRFTKCTFSQSTLRDVLFRDCKWKDIYFSGNETVFEKTYVSNPSEFVAAHYVTRIDLNHRVLSEKKLLRI